MRVYVASSWRNPLQPQVVKVLRAAGHEVYDFRRGQGGFHWADVGAGFADWGPQRAAEALDHELCEKAFGLDMDALKAAEAVVLVQPCGISAHLELGYAAGTGKKTVVWVTDGEPELMYKMCDRLCTTLDEVVEALS